MLYFCNMSILEDKQPKRTPLSELGEFGLIEHLTADFESKNSNTIYGIGDDAAVIDVGEKYQLISTDMLVEGIHFDLTYTPLKHLGYKAVTVNVSDICAMNGEAKQITISIAVSNRFPVEAVEELYKGIHLACTKYQVDLVGGDTTSSQSGLLNQCFSFRRGGKRGCDIQKRSRRARLVGCFWRFRSAYLGLQVLSRKTSF